MKQHRLTLWLDRTFLARREPDPAWTPGRRRLFWSWNIVMVLLSGLGLGLCSMFMAAGPYFVSDIYPGWLARPLIPLLNLLPVVVLVLLLYALTCRAALAFFLSSLVVLGLSAGNYFKLMFRDDPLMFADLLLLKEAGNMAGRYRLFIDRRIVIVLSCAVLGTLFLALFVRGKPRRKSPLGLALLLTAVAGTAALTPALLSDGIYNGAAACYDYIPNPWSATQQYIAHGAVYPFLHSAVETVQLPPAGYSAPEAAGRLADYPDADIPDSQKVNVIAVMLEAYNDFTKFGTPQLKQDVYQTWRQLTAEGYSGELVTNIFAAGTVDTERCFLTGYLEGYNFRANTNSYPWYFRSQGYTVEGMHPCYQWFYNRKNVNAYLGFEEYYFVENYYSPITQGKVATDDIFFRELLNTYRAGLSKGKPYFNFSVSYQGHGPYDEVKYYWGDRGSYIADDGTYTDAEHCILENYFGSIADTNRQLKAFTDALRSDPEPVVLVLFGDHNPWMGNGNSVYTALGIDFDMSTQKGFTDYYSTPYLIWANPAAKRALGRDFRGQGPDIGPYFLMDEVFRLCGWEGPAYLQAMEDVQSRVQVVHTTGRCMADGLLIDRPEGEVREAVESYRKLEYYQRTHFLYDAWK